MKIKYADMRHLQIIGEQDDADKIKNPDSA